MNEAQVSLDHSTYPLPRPFMVLATQNPIEYEGTYPLPESQLDRFLLRIRIGYPEASDEKAVLRGNVAPTPARLAPVVTVEEVLGLQDEADRVRADESVLDYLVSIVETTRRSSLLSLGVSPRGSLALLRAARARALTEGRDYVVPDDIQELAVAALAHRIIPKARLGGEPGGAMGGEDAIRAVLQDVRVPR
jgi:MoxR-like ATPase